jgi:hypothetical protein
MKRIFTLLFALGTIAAVQAQPGQRNNRDFDDRKDNARVIIKDNDDFDNGYRNDGIDNGYRNNGFDKSCRSDDRFSPERKIAMEVAQINREYDYKIQMVWNNYFMSRFVKYRKIDQLEEERRWEIRMVYKKYSRYRRGFDNQGHF